MVPQLSVPETTWATHPYVRVRAHELQCTSRSLKGRFNRYNNAFKLSILKRLDIKVLYCSVLQQQHAMTRIIMMRDTVLYWTNGRIRESRPLPARPGLLPPSKASRTDICKSQICTMASCHDKGAWTSKRPALKSRAGVGHLCSSCCHTYSTSRYAYSDDARRERPIRACAPPLYYEPDEGHCGSRKNVSTAVSEATGAQM